MAEDTPPPDPREFSVSDPTKLRFYLNCESERSLFILSRDGERWRQYFTDLADALDDAASRVTEETPITILNAAGQVVLESVIVPKSARS